MLLKIGLSRHNSLRRKTPAKALLKLGVISFATVAFWTTYLEARTHLNQPEAIFVLGGDETREHFAAKLAVEHPDLPVWVSGGSPESYAYHLFRDAGVERDRVNLDYQAVDTVTNFTSLVEDLEEQNIKSIYLVTSDTHMLRAQVIGKIVFGSRGITMKSVPVPSNHQDEPLEKSIRDGARSLLWLVTGETGEAWIKIVGEP